MYQNNSEARQGLSVPEELEHWDYCDKCGRYTGIFCKCDSKETAKEFTARFKKFIERMNFEIGMGDWPK